MAVLQRLALRGTPKATKAAARYTPAGGAERCGMCRHYVPSSSCARIEGPVSAAGWCQLYSQQVTWRPRAGQDAGLNTGGAPPGATLDISFMTPGSLPSGVVFTRASTATYFDVAGVLQTAAINAPRWDYNPSTLALNGLLIEEARTNSVLNSATLGTQSVTVTAVPWTLSFYGTGTVTKSGAATGALVGTGATQRVSQTFTPTAGSLTLTVTGSVTNAQLEAGAFVTSYIASAGAAATRAIDSATMPTSPWATGTLAFSYAVEAALVTAGAAPVVFDMDDGTTNNRTQLGYNSGTAILVFFQNLAGAGTATMTAGTVTATVPFKAAVSTISGAHQCALNGTVNTVGGSSANNPPPGITTARLGRPLAATPGAQWLRRVRYWPRALSAAELQSVTT